MTTRALAISIVLSFLVACGGGSSPNDGGTAGGGGGRGGSAGGGGGSSAGTGGSGTGGSGNCQMCIQCVQTNCASQLTACQANTDCNAIYQCAMACTMTLNDCILAHQAGVLAWGPGVAACANQNCISNGCPY